MLLTAAFSNLLAEGKLNGGERVYKYLGIKSPLLSSQTVDPRSNNIISLELAEHTAGLPGEGAGDPLFEMRDIEVALGAQPLTETQFAQYLYGTPLLSQPRFHVALFQRRLFPAQHGRRKGRPISHITTT